MKSLKTSNDFHILQGPAVKLQKSLDAMSDRYEVIVHAVNIVSNGDAVIVVERRKTDRQQALEDINS